MDNVTSVNGMVGFEKFAPFLADRSFAVKTECEGFAVIQLGRVSKDLERTLLPPLWFFWKSVESTRNTGIRSRMQHSTS